eukprot:SM000013S26541  [mRNA]  locus=s13:929606:931562:- [translate_table: standard]
MGSGIAQLAAVAGMDVIMTDVARPALDRGTAAMAASLGRLVRKGRLTQASATATPWNPRPSADDADASLARVTTTTDLDRAAEAGFVIEAVAEDEGLKRSIFERLDRLCRPSAILATNTSSISITRIASSTRRPQQVIGMHFMNPPPIMKLVEIVRGLATNDAVVDATTSLASRLGKSVTYAKDYPGFIVNRILMPMVNEGFYALMEGVAEAKDIDTSMTLGTNQPVGPLQLADFIGLDTCLAIMNVLHQGLGDSKYRPCPLLKQYVDAGWLGKKAGRGVYLYDKE